MKRMIFGTLVACFALHFAPPASFAAPGFDGTWSVLVVTENGTCDRAYRYEVQIAGGQVKPAGEAAVSMSGAVSGNGAIKVNVGRGDQKASGSGRLAGKAGTGKWTGRGSAGTCSGTWSAERRS
ncbi:MAG: hypothetical protein JWN71_3025 [Xanthobacteraceae bacterium]|jgi:hypothetical protein|nr:hypothetical protein [Xanthobacteraceae bacterium]